MSDVVFEMGEIHYIFPFKFYSIFLFFLPVAIMGCLWFRKINGLGVVLFYFVSTIIIVSISYFQYYRISSSQYSQSIKKMEGRIEIENYNAREKIVFPNKEVFMSTHDFYCFSDVDAIKDGDYIKIEYFGINGSRSSSNQCITKVTVIKP